MIEIRALHVIKMKGNTSTGNGEEKQEIRKKTWPRLVEGSVK